MCARIWRGAAVASIGAAALAGCERSDPAASPTSTAKATAPSTSGRPSSFEMQTAAPGGGRLIATISRDRMTVADRMTFTLEIDAPARTDVRWPTIENTLGSFTVAAREEDLQPRSGTLQTSDAASLIRTRRYVLEPFLPGRHTIPPLEVSLIPKEGEATLLATPPLEVLVSGVLGDDATKAAAPAFRDLVTPAPEPSAEPTSWTAVVTIAGSAATLCGVTAAVMLMRRRNDRTRVDPAAVARADLDALARDAAALDAAAFATRLAAALRFYLAARVPYAAASLTTSELAAALHSASVPEDLAAMVTDLLGRADLVKFAGRGMNMEERTADVAAVRRVIDLLESRATAGGEGVRDAA